MKIIILGGGASGLMLANILAKNHINADIEIIEKYEHVGKKLLITGNGRCKLQQNHIIMILVIILPNHLIQYNFLMN